MQKAKFLLAWAVCVALLIPVQAQTKKSGSPPAKPKTASTTTKAAPAASRRTIQFEDVKLKNGLRVVMVEDHSAPTYAVCLTYNVGSRDERQGRTGFAHLFEHMMFQGSENVGKGEHMLLVQNNGGTMNGSTNNDRTNYFESLPINQLDLGLFLESDRMRSLAVTAANLENQRKTVQEERRQGVDNRPYGKSEEILEELAYDNFAYKHSVIGSMADLDAASLQDVKDFFRIYYAPNNAVLTLVGDFKTADALAKVKKYFEDIPSQPAPQEPDMTEPKQAAERRQTVEDPFAQTPQVVIVYKVPKGNTPDNYALGVAGDVLGSGRSSRLYQALVKEKELATNVMAGVDERRGTSLFEVRVSARPEANLEEIETTVYAEVERLKAAPVTDGELKKIHMAERRMSAMRMQSSLFRAMQLGVYTVYFNDPNLINTHEDKVNAVTKADVQRVAKTYLETTNRTVVVTVPKSKTAKAGTAPSPAF